MMDDKQAQHALFSPEEAFAWEAKWARARDRELERIRAMTLEEKALMTADLMETASQMGWLERARGEKPERRKLWRELRRRWVAIFQQK